MSAIDKLIELSKKLPKGDFLQVKYRRNANKRHMVYIYAGGYKWSYSKMIGLVTIDSEIDSILNDIISASLQAKTGHK